MSNEYCKPLVKKQAKVKYDLDCSKLKDIFKALGFHVANMPESRMWLGVMKQAITDAVRYRSWEARLYLLDKSSMAYQMLELEHDYVMELFRKSEWDWSYE